MLILLLLKKKQKLIRQPTNYKLGQIKFKDTCEKREEGSGIERSFMTAEKWWLIAESDKMVDLPRNLQP